MISIKNLTVKYGSKLIYDGVTVEVPDQGINFVMGKNGAGKTTLMKCLLNHKTYTGEIRIDNERYKNDKRKVFAVFDVSTLYKNLTGLQNIMLITGACKEVVYERGTPFLNRELLRKKAKTYSYGERKKIFLIIVDILRPRLLIMDEVSNGLDYETMVILKKKLKVWENDSMIVLTGHQFEFYKDIVEHIFIVFDGNIKRISKEDDISLEELYEKTFEGY